MWLSFLSALLAIVSYPPLGLYGFAFVALIPYFSFVLGERSLLRLFAGTLVFRIALAAYVAVVAFEPIIFLQSAVLFFGFPLSVYLVKRMTGRELVWFCVLPPLFAFWEHVESRLTLLPYFVVDIGINLAPSPFLGLARFGGVEFLMLFVAAVNAALLFALKRLRFSISFSRAPRIFSVSFDAAGRRGLLVALVLLVAGFVLSRVSLRGRSEEYQRREDIVEILLVSTTEAFDREVEDFPDGLGKTELDHVGRLIAQRLAPIKERVLQSESAPDLVVFPEDIFRNEYTEDRDEEAFEKFGVVNAGTLIRQYREFAKSTRSRVLVYTTVVVASGERYNMGMLFAQDGSIVDVYKKRYLAYGGEFWPFGEWRPFYVNWARETVPNIVKRSPVFDPRLQFARGGETKNFSLAGEIVFGTPICGELHYPFVAKKFVDRGARFLIHSSSNNWAIAGFRKYLESVVWLRQIEAAWLGVPILVNGRRDLAGAVYPDGSVDMIDFENSENFAVYRAQIKL